MPGRVQRLTLVEMTVMLSVIAVISAVVVPTVMTYVAQSRRIRAQQDVRTIGLALQRFWHDTGIVPGQPDPRTAIAYGVGFDVLTTDGREPVLGADANECGAWLNSASGRFEDHLSNNVPGYPLKADAHSPGWNGPYVAAPPQADPWGQCYMVNSVFLAPGEPLIRDDGTVNNAVFVLSAGANGKIETPFDQPATMVATNGDDIVHRLQ